MQLSMKTLGSTPSIKNKTKQNKVTTKKKLHVGSWLISVVEFSWKIVEFIFSNTAILHISFWSKHRWCLHLTSYTLEGLQDPFLHVIITYLYYYLLSFDNGHSNWHEVISHVVFICISLIINVEHVFSYTSWPFICLLLKNVYCMYAWHLF